MNNKPNVWLCSDWHFSHKNIVKFEHDGKKVRPWDTTEEMDEALIERHNALVKPGDKVYHLGDAVINRKALPLIGRLNGDKILIKGNHDVFRLEEYAQYFKDIRGTGELAGFVLTHVPVHPNELAPKGRWKGNFHGHLHTEVVTKEKFDGYWKGTTWVTYTNTEMVPDPLYLCVSMEQIGFAPISLDDAIKKWEAQQ